MPTLAQAHPSRKVFMTLHHTTSHIDSTTNHLAPDSCSVTGYDVQVYGSGGWQVGNRIDNSPGCHARTTRSGVTSCNSNSIGIGVQGCFGSTDATCSGKGDTHMRANQTCSLASIWLGLGFPPTGGNSWDHLRPHNYCTPTQCCGNNYTSGGTSAYNYYNTAGRDLANLVRKKAYCIRNVGHCNC